MASDPQVQSGYRIFRRVLDEQRGHWKQFISILLLSLAVAPLVLVPAFAMKIAVDCYVSGKALPGFVAAVVPESVATSSPGNIG